MFPVQGKSGLIISSKEAVRKMGINYFNRDDRDLKFVLFEQLDLSKILSYEA